MQKGPVELELEAAEAMMVEHWWISFDWIFGYDKGL